MPNTKMTYEVWLGLDKVERISLIDEINPYSDYSDHPILNGLLKDFQEWAEIYKKIAENLDIEKMKIESSSFLGNHDLNAFRSAHCQSKNSFKTNQIKLAKEQRKLSKKVKFSSNWQQQKRKITQLHSKIANTRKDYIHKVSNEICKNHTRIFIEDLKIEESLKELSPSDVYEDSFKMLSLFIMLCTSEPDKVCLYFSST